MTTPLTLLLILLLLGVSCMPRERPPDWKGAYFGQGPPGQTAVLFAPGILSTGMHDDAGPAFTADLREVFFRIAQAPHSVILCMSRRNDVWSRPEVVSFSGRYSDGIPGLSPDGRRIYYASYRPLDGVGEPRGDEDLWYVDRVGGQWGEPVHLGPEINTPSGEFGPSISAQGTLYFTSNRDGEDGRWGIFRSRWVEGRHAPPERLSDAINDPDASCPCIAPDESFIVFSSRKREDTLGGGDLYVSFRLGEGEWSEAINLGGNVNSEGFDYFPTLSPDGKYLFFVSTRAREWSFSTAKRTYEEMVRLYQGPCNGRNDIYWVDTAVIDVLRPDQRR